MNVLPPHIHISQTPEQLAREAATRFVEVARKAIAANHRFTLAVSGGTTPKLLFKLLASPPYLDAVDWGHVHVFFADERFVPHDHPDSNCLLLRETLLTGAPIPQANLFPMPTDGADPEACAGRYAATLESCFAAALPRFDLVLLGMGPDGHTASLFPGFTETTSSVVAVYDSPKPPPRRLSLSLAAIQQASDVWFLVAGADKADTLHTIFSGSGEQLPAARVRSAMGNPLWLMDRDASFRLAMGY